MSDEFKVNDKRRFDSEGKANSGISDEKTSEPIKDFAESEEKKQKFDMPEMNFMTFILSFATSAQIQLGLIPSPVSNQIEEDLTLAKQTIDVLGMLQEKTKGNLDDSERKLLEQALYELRMLYIEKDKQSKLKTK